MLKYCIKCMMPETKPDLSFVDGVCNACINFESRNKINWEKRETELNNILNKYRNNNSSNWDCIIPVSGGKDSTYQVVTALELNMNPLCVTSRTCDLSHIGRENLDNIRNLGVDLIEVGPDAKTRNLLNRIGLLELGDISWPEHVGIFTIPVRIAVNFKIPLIIWGENSQNEYGGPAGEEKNNILDRRWLEEFGGLIGMRVSDLNNYKQINKKKLIAYTYPNDEEIKKVQVTGLFLGHYLPWDGKRNAEIAKENGFKPFKTRVEGSLVDYENLDNHQTGIHDYFKFLKFGFGRVTDLACLSIRRNRITRSQAKEFIIKYDGKFPHTYLDKSIENILKPLNISLDEFIECCDKFTNKNLFLKDNEGKLLKDKDGNLTKISYDNS
ncbi:MAG: flagellin modification protein, PseA [Candidatus Endolissoclinum sp. TMED37]|nr:MAG: flagellin modification protein, PseA [Candidatus Endolissoclinum sp. TMED37]